jgi:hypothetical protein
MNDHDLHDLFAAPDELAPLDPATIIAGAQRRRRRRDLFAGGVAAVAVLAVAVGSLVVVNRSNAGGPAEPPIAGVSTPTPKPPAAPSHASKLTRTACVAAYKGWAPIAPSTKAATRGTIDGAEGRLMIVADSKYVGVCENSYGSEPSIRRAARVTDIQPDNHDAFALATDRLDVPGRTYQLYWGAGLFPLGAQGVHFTFPDGKTVEAKVVGRYWMLRYRSSTVPTDFTKTSRIRVQVWITAPRFVIQNFQLTWGQQTCAQISHGC